MIPLNKPTSHKKPLHHHLFQDLERSQADDELMPLLIEPLLLLPLIQIWNRPIAKFEMGFGCQKVARAEDDKEVWYAVQDGRR